jgi:hypothetical protein
MNQRINPIERLMSQEKDWEKAIVFGPGNLQFAISTGTVVVTNGETVRFTNTETPDPFYDHRVDGPQPKMVTMEIEIPVNQLAVNFVTYSKIVVRPNGIITNL